MSCVKNCMNQTMWAQEFVQFTHLLYKTENIEYILKNICIVLDQALANFFGKGPCEY